MNNKREQLIKVFVEVGKQMKHIAQQDSYEHLSRLVDRNLYDCFNLAIEREKNYNGWFTPDAIRNAINSLANWLTEDELNNWTSPYAFTTSPKKVGVIMAGNIPFVGFHDFLCIVLSGHKAMLKPSSDDARLWPLLLELIQVFYPSLNEHVSLVPQLKDIDAVIATGSDNSARYFEKYFGHLPHIIRKNRTSLAVIKGDETDDELKLLGSDIFTYFGLGCRNVSQLLVKKGFDLDRIFGAIIDYSPIINTHKYANNYDYYKAIFLMNKVKVIENGFLLTQESADLFAPTAVLNIHYYSNEEEVANYLATNEDKIQVIVGTNYTPFGKAQNPDLTDYADGVDTLRFLENL